MFSFKAVGVLNKVFCEALKDLFSGCTENCQKMGKEVLDIKV
jgi:hypothetical protein